MCMSCIKAMLRVFMANITILFDMHAIIAKTQALRTFQCQVQHDYKYSRGEKTKSTIA